MLGLLGLCAQLKKSCAREGCTHVFVHGYSIDDTRYICEKCFKEFTEALDNDKQPNAVEHSRGRCMKYVEKDLRKFMKTTKGETFTPSIIKDKHVVIWPFDVFYKRQVEVLDPEPTAWEVAFEAKWAENRRLDALRYIKFQDNPVFVSQFRQLLSTCDDETLIHLMKLGEFHALQYNVEKCDECGDDDSGIELEHDAKGLGEIWLNTVAKVNASDMPTPKQF